MEEYDSCSDPIIWDKGFVVFVHEDVKHVRNEEIYMAVDVQSCMIMCIYGPKELSSIQYTPN